MLKSLDTLGVYSNEPKNADLVHGSTILKFNIFPESTVIRLVSFWLA